MSTIIPAQDNVDIEIEDDKIIISQSTSGNYESVAFHRIHLPAIIAALQQINNETRGEEWT